MLRKFSFLLLFLACWQALAGVVLPLRVAFDQNAHHAALHWTQQAHHHHEDNYHFDLSAQSNQHLMQDEFVYTALEVLHIAISLLLMLSIIRIARQRMLIHLADRPESLFRPPRLVTIK